MRHVLSILFGAAFTLFSCWATGKLFLARWKLEVFSEELQIFRFAVGAGLFSLFILILAAMNLARVGVFLVAGAIVIVASFRVHQEDRLRLPDFSSSWKFLLFVILIGFGTFYFVNAAAPEISPDGSTYHLGLVAKYLRQHGLGRITSNFYASLSEGLEMLFLVAFSLGRHSAAALVEFGFFAAIPLVMVAYAQRFGFPKAGVAAAIIIFCSPVFGISGSSAYNDAAAVLILFCLFYALQIWDATRQNGMLVVAGLLAGFCYGIKYTLFLAAPYCLGFVLWKLYRSRQPIVRPLIVVCAGAALLIAPWWIKNWVTVQNPISPFGNKVFSNPYLTPRFESDYVKGQSSVVPARDRFVESTIRGGSTGGFLGPLFLLSPLGLLALRYRQGRQVVLAAAIFLIPTLANAQTRFLMLAAPFLALALSLAVMKARGALLVFAFAAPILAIPAVADAYCDPWAWRLHDFPFDDAVRATSEHDSLKRRLPGFDIVELLNTLVPPKGKVFLTGVPDEAYLMPGDVVAYESALGQTLGDMLNVAVIPDWAPTWILTFRFPERQLRRVRVVQTANGKDEDEWRIGEFKVYRAGKELPQTKQWKYHTNANPWEIGYAFDNVPVTRWRSGIGIFNGMKVELDLGRPEAIDRVELECSHDQYSIRLKLEAEDTLEHWALLAASPSMSDRPVTGNMRRAATEQFRAHGVTHILMYKDDYVAADFRKDPSAWGVSLIGETGGNCLYEIK
jgi:hypothetical protein